MKRKPINIDKVLELFNDNLDLNESAIANIQTEQFCVKAKQYGIKKFQSAKLLQQIKTEFQKLTQQNQYNKQPQYDNNNNNVMNQYDPQNNVYYLQQQLQQAAMQF
eukprot:130070_1